MTTQTIHPGCGCKLCAEPFTIPPAYTPEENLRRQLDYEAKHHAHAIRYGLPTDKAESSRDQGAPYAAPHRPAHSRP